MTCKRHAEIILLDARPLADDVRASLEAHAAACDTCGATLAALRRAHAALHAEHPAPPSPAARGRAWAAIELARAEQEGNRTWLDALGRPRALVPAGALALAFAVAALIVRGPSHDDAGARPDLHAEDVRGATEAAAPALPLGRPLQAERGAVLALGGARVALGAPARFTLEKTELETTAFRLEDGAAVTVTAERAPERPLELSTPEVRLQLVAATAVVARTERGTTLTVERGAVLAWPRGQAWPRTIAAGAALELPAHPRAASEPDVQLGETSALERAPAAHEAAQRREATPASSAPARAAAEPQDLSEQRIDRAPGTEAVLREVPSNVGASRAGGPARAAPTADEVGPLAAEAAAERREGHLARAAELYRRVAEHPAGASYREQALLERALVLAELGDTRAALATLAEASSLHPTGATAPERAALEAELLLRGHDAAGAARAIERTAHLGRSPRLALARVEVARVLVSTDAARTRALLAGALEAELPRARRLEALQLAARAARALGEVGEALRLEDERRALEDR